MLIVFAPAHMPNGYDAIGNAIAVAQSCVLKFAMHFEMDGCLSVTGYSGWSVITPIIRGTFLYLPTLPLKLSLSLSLSAKVV